MVTGLEREAILSGSKKRPLVETLEWTLRW